MYGSTQRATFIGYFALSGFELSASCQFTLHHRYGFAFRRILLEHRDGLFGISLYASCLSCGRLLATLFSSAPRAEQHRGLNLRADRTWFWRGPIRSRQSPEAPGVQTDTR